MTRNVLLEVKGLETTFFTDDGAVRAIDNVSFDIHEGEILGIVGESGCGKSVTSLSIMGLVPNPPGKITAGEIVLNNRDLTKLSDKEMRSVRGKDVAMIFQEPMTSLNPLFTIGNQLVEAIRIHNKSWSKKQAINRAVEIMQLVGLPRANELINEYPHQLSGGMRQRVMIAMALVCDPKVLIADEPTTALDVTIQAQILKLMRELNERLNTAIMLITHDLGVVAETCERVVVMYAGQVVEETDVFTLFENPQHPYTKGLLKSIPRFDMDRNQRLSPIIGSPPDLFAPPEGCSFYSRCEHAMKVCKQHDPALEEVRNNQLSACWLHHPLAKKVKITLKQEKVNACLSIKKKKENKPYKSHSFK